MDDLEKVMKTEKRHLVLSVITILLALCISLLFAKGVEGKTYLFHLLERVGGHNLALETNMFGMVAVVLIFLLYLLHKAFYEKLYYIGVRNIFLKYAVFIALGISILFQFIAGPMQRGIMGWSKGLDTVIDQSRISNNNCGFDFDEDGDPSSYGHRVDFINYGSEKVQFYLKFEDFNNPDKTY